MRFTSSVLVAVAAVMTGPSRGSGGPLGEPPELTNPEKAAVAACNAFGIDLYRAACAGAPTENLFLSPYSMSVALTMTAEGARGKTEEEVARTMHFPAAGADGRAVTALHPGYAGLASRFRAAAGAGDDQTRKRIESLRKKLDQANRRAEQLQQDRKWSEVGRAHAEAKAAADELNTLLATVDRFDLRIANALWVEKTYPLQSEFVRTLDRFYGTGGVTALNIAGQTERSRLRINAWVETNTEKRITNLIPAGALAPDARLVITNAVYFKGQWASPFAAESTRDEDFTLAGDTTVRAKMMRGASRASTPYAAFDGHGEFFETPRVVPADRGIRPRTYPDDAGFLMIDLPYKGGGLSMVVIAPRSANGLAAVEKRLTADSLGSWLAKLDARTVDTAVPRFTMESSHDMSRVLGGMGMRRAFTNPAGPDGAEFPGMTASEDPMHQLFIGSVLHKAWVEVNEKGTEAAAATAVIMAPSSVAEPPAMVPFTPQFRADRPFLFLIRDANTGLVLFMGRVMDPAAL